MTADCKHKVSNIKQKSLYMHNDMLYSTMQETATSAHLFQPIQVFYSFCNKKKLLVDLLCFVCSNLPDTRVNQQVTNSTQHVYI